MLPETLPHPHRAVSVPLDLRDAISLQVGCKLLHNKMDRENITSIGKWEITRKLNTYYSAEAKEIVDSYGGPWKLPPTVKQQLLPYATQKWTKPFLWRNWKKKETLPVVK